MREISLLHRIFGVVYPGVALPDNEKETLRLLHERVVAIESSPQERWSLARKIGEALDRFIPVANAWSGKLLYDGILPFFDCLSPRVVAEVMGYIEGKPVCGAHVAGLTQAAPIALEEAKEKFIQASYSLATVIGAPHLKDFVLSPQVLELIRGYLGCEPVLYSANLMWTFPGKGAVAQDWHRDQDGFRFVTLMVYLTDVGGKNGPHRYKVGSHRALGGAVTQIEGNAGAMLLEDGYGLHMGVPVEEGARLVFWARYGQYDNGYSAHCGDPVESGWGTPEHRKIMRSLLK